MKKLMSAMPWLALCMSVSARADTDAAMDRLLNLSLNDLMSLKVRISTNTSQTLSKVPSVVSIITAADIKATGATNLTDILQSIPGIYVRANLFGFRPIVTFRGAAGNQTLLMVNGEPMSDLIWTSGIYWKGLPTTMIERVEIIRGPGSALFGAGASAGVINVITKSAGTIRRTEAGARLGSFDSQEGWLESGGTWNGFDIGITADFSHSDGHNPYIAVDGQTAADNVYGTHVSYAPADAHYGWNGQMIDFSASRGNWRLLADYIGHSNLETGLTGAAVLDPLTRANDHRLNLALHYDDEHFSDNWGLSAELRYHYLDYSSGNGYQERPPGYTNLTGVYPDGQLNVQRAAEQGTTFEASGQYTGFRRHTIRVGGGYSMESLFKVQQWANYGTGPDGTPIPAGSSLVDLSGSPYAFAPEMARRIHYLFAQDIWTLSNDLELTAGGRYDHYSDFGSAVNPRLALVWQSTPRLTTKLMYGRAFRAPTYLELYSRTSATLPNPNLKPERSNTLDLLFSYAVSNDLNVSIDLYRFKQSNLIAADASNQFQNVGDSTTQGVELETRWRAAEHLTLSGNISHRHVQNATFVNHSVPTNKAYLRMDWSPKANLNWDVQANWIGKRSLPAQNPRAPLPAYTLVDTTLRYSPVAHWEVAASIRNLFDADAREYSSGYLPYNLPLPGRSFYTEIRYKF